MILGRIHSLQSLGTVDGPGVRFVVFFQGCPLRCHCCHNPDTWDPTGGTQMRAGQILERILRVKDYFGPKGGVTLSGGEPLLQAEFARELLALCHREGLNTCLDTAGCRLDEAAQSVLEHCDRVLLDIKYTDPDHYRQYVGGDPALPLQFLQLLEERHIPTTLRQVVIRGLHDTPENLLALKQLKQNHSCVDTVELLPFRTLCQTKYDAMGLPFPFARRQAPDPQALAAMEQSLQEEG